MRTHNCDHYVVWGFRNSYHTHSHIHEGLYRALAWMFRDTHATVEWLDEHSHVDVNRPNTFFITNHDVAPQLPAREDSFYLVHGGADYQYVRERFWHLRGHMSWNVFIDANYTEQLPPHLAPADSKGRRPINRPEAVWVGEDAPYYPDWNHMDFRWATDLLPWEIEANKLLAHTLNPDSRVIHYIGTYWRVNEVEINQFRTACNETGIELRHHGAGQAETGFNYLGRNNVVSIEDNARLVRESYFAPAIVGSHHLTEGYVPCRIFKNISYGAFGVTNSEKAQKLFGGRLIHNNDPHQLFFDAVSRLAETSRAELHELMDFVAQKHTYLNRLDAIFKAAELAWES